MYSHTEILKKIPLFSKLNPKELEELTHIANAQTHQKGSILIEEGTYGGELYILINGELSIWKKDTTGHALELSQLKEAGDFVGEMSLFDQKPRSATVEVRKQSEILKIERKDLLSKLSNPQNILIKILEEISFAIISREKIATGNPPECSTALTHIFNEKAVFPIPGLAASTNN